MDDSAPRVGHKKSRKGCAQCKRRHVKCNEESPCSNCIRHKVACSLAGGPYVPREDAKGRRTSTASSSASLAGASIAQTTSQESPMSGPTITSAMATSSIAATGSRRISPQPSPFSVLTGLLDRPCPNDARSWIQDLELMHYYMMHTTEILTDRDAPDYIHHIWRVELPRVAFTFDYLMHGVLGLTALHKAHVERIGAKELRECAVDHLDKALVLYRSANGPATAENANAKFLFTWLVALFAYAIPPSLPSIDAMVELFMLVKGIDAILSETWFWVSQGAFAPILTRGFQEAIMPTAEGLPDGMDHGLKHLDFMLSVEVMVPEEQATCNLLLDELKQIYDTVLHGQTTPGVATILCFPKQESAPFAKLVKRRLPQALVILAYYCVVLDILRTRWWIHGWSRRVLQDVLSSLDEQWRHWIEWPVQAVLVEQQRLRPPATTVPMAVTDFLAVNPR